MKLTSRSNGPGENSIARTAPAERPGLEEVNDTINEFGSKRRSASKTEIMPYWVAIARYCPDLEKESAKLPLI